MFARRLTLSSWDAVADPQWGASTRRRSGEPGERKPLARRPKPRKCPDEAGTGDRRGKATSRRALIMRRGYYGAGMKVLPRGEVGTAARTARPVNRKTAQVDEERETRSSSSVSH